MTITVNDNAIEKYNNNNKMCYAMITTRKKERKNKISKRTSRVRVRIYIYQSKVQ